MPEFNKENKNPDGQAWTVPKTYTEEEYKNLQSFWTKANQTLIDTSKKLAEKEPKELLTMEVNIQNKVIKDIWWYDNIDELKTMLPDILSWEEENGNNTFDDESDAFKQLKREQELLKMKLNKKDVDDEIEKFTTAHSELLKSIPNFAEKVREELKYISSELPNNKRVERATKLVSWNSDINVDAYLQLQWKNVVKASGQKMTEEHAEKARNQLRATFWLAQK